MFHVLLFLIAVAVPLTAGAQPGPSSFAEIRRVASPASQGGQAFESGVAAWEAKRYSDARNAWVRALAWMEKDEPSALGPRDALQELIVEAERRSRPEPPAPAAVETPSPPAPPPARRPRVRTAPNVPNGAAILEKARLARRRGEKEKALKLYRIAEQLPGGKAAAAEAEALEAEVNQPAR